MTRLELLEYLDVQWAKPRYNYKVWDTFLSVSRQLIDDACVRHMVPLVQYLGIMLESQTNIRHAAVMAMDAGVPVEDLYPAFVLLLGTMKDEE